MAGLTEPNQILKREDLADLISIADMKQTPFLTRARKLKMPRNTLFEWGVDAYETPKTTGVVDGTDVSEYEDHSRNRARLKNNIQIFRRTAKVSRLAENVSDVAGETSPIATATAKKIKELGRDMEATFLSSNDAQSESGSAEYLTCAFGTWISTAGPTTYTVPAAFRTPAAQVISVALTSLVEDTHLQGFLQSVYDTTGMNGDYVMVCGSDLRRRFTDCLRTAATAISASVGRVRTFTSAASETTVSTSVAVFEGDFGTIEVLPSNFIGFSAGAPSKKLGYLLDFDKCGIKWSQATRGERLPDLGGGPRVLLEAVAGLQVDNPLGFGKIVGS
jgi:hypothetical protein